jgi:uncharacterized membrane protein
MVVVVFWLVVGAILYGAARIIAGWLIPAGYMARFDAAVGATLNGFMKFVVVAVAAFILWALVRSPT